MSKERKNDPSVETNEGNNGKNSSANGEVAVVEPAEKRSSAMSYILAIFALAYFALGAVLIFNAGALSTIVCIMGVLLILMGIWWIMRYLRNDSHIEPSNYDFSFGVLMSIVGILLLVQNRNIAGWLPHLLAVSVVITSVMKMQNTLALRRLRDQNWTLFFLMACITLIMACVILFNKSRFISKDGTVHIYVSVMLIVDGVLNLINMFRLAHKLRIFNEKGMNKG